MKMLNQDKIKLIREKCITANPEIVELKFGALIRWKFQDGERIAPYGWYAGNDDQLPPDEIKDNPYFVECLGRPIRLAYVLLAFGNRVHNDDRIDDFIAGMTYSWNLRTDDLEKQSEETIHFLYELLQ